MRKGRENEAYTVVLQNHDKPLENVVRHKYLETTVINQNVIQGEINERLNSSNVLPFGLGSPVFPSGFEKCKNYNIRNYNFA
jgi:hypothetical protein